MAGAFPAATDYHLNGGISTGKPTRMKNLANAWKDAPGRVAANAIVDPRQSLSSAGMRSAGNTRGGNRPLALRAPCPPVHIRPRRETRQIAPPCVFHAFGRRQVTACQFGTVPHRTEQDLGNLLAPLARSHVCESTIKSRSTTQNQQSADSRRQCGQIYRAPLEQVTLLQIVASTSAYHGYAASIRASSSRHPAAYRPQSVVPATKLKTHFDRTGRTWRRTLDTCVPV